MGRTPRMVADPRWLNERVPYGHQFALANALGRHQTTISRILSAERPLLAKYFPALRQFLGNPNEDIPLVPDTQLREIAKTLRKGPLLGAESVVSHPVLPDTSTPDGTAKEGSVADVDYAALTFYLMKGLPRAEQRVRYRQFRKLLRGSLPPPKRTVPVKRKK